jgi:hypothetical protein
LYLWSGDITSVPATPTYSLTKTRPTTDFAEFNTDISKIVRDELDVIPNFTTATGVVDTIGSSTDTVIWCKWVASFTDAVETIPDIENFIAFTDGYGLYSEGVNPTSPTTEALTDVASRKVERSNVVVFPFINNGTITSIDYDTNGTDINVTETITLSNLSTNYVQYGVVDLSATTDDYLTIKVLPSGDEFVYEIIDECRYDSLAVYFQNKYGAIETVSLNKKRSDSLNVESSEFVNNYISSGVYSTTKHQYQKINVVGMKTFTVNSGYILESENDLYEQMLLSEKVWIYEGGYVPVNVKSSSLQFKTRVNDKLVNYSIEFSYAYNTIQNI